MARLSLRKRIIFSTVMTLGLLLLAEAIATIYYEPEWQAWETPPPSPQKGVPVMVGNPYLLYEYPRGTIQERGVTVSINSLGLRGPEIEIPKPESVARLLTTGDSSIFGFGVEYDDTFSTVAATRLNEDGGRPVEPIIGAIPGYSTFQTINLLELRALKAEPDLLVVANLWSDNNFDSFVDKEALAETTAFQDSVVGRMRSLLSKSRLFRVLDWNWRLENNIAKVRAVEWMKSGRPQIGLRRVEINDYARNLDRIAQMALEHDAGLVFMVPANNEDMGEAGPDARSGKKAWDPYRQVMRDTAARYGAPLIDVPALFQQSGLGREQLFLDEMHPTAAGHRIMGEALASVLEQKGWPEQELPVEDSGDEIATYDDPFIQGAAAAGGPAGSGPPGGLATSGNTIEGHVRFDDYEDGVIQVEALQPGSGNSPTILSSIQLRGRESNFTLPVGQAEKVVLRAYLDHKGDGPDAEDTLFDLTATVIEVEEGQTSGIVVDLDERTVEVPGAG